MTVSVLVAGRSVSVRRRRGSSPTLVFLHYWGGSARTWDQVIEHLGGQDAVTYDQRGWGSAASLTGPYSLQQMAADVDAIAAREGLKHVVLVGHSMGGKVAQIVAGRRPSYLSGLVLLAPALLRESLLTSRSRRGRSPCPPSSSSASTTRSKHRLSSRS